MARPSVRCPACGKLLAVKAEQAGKKLRCPGCQNPVSVPTAAEADPDPPAPAATPARGPASPVAPASARAAPAGDPAPAVAHPVARASTRATPAGDPAPAVAPASWHATPAGNPAPAVAPASARAAPAGDPAPAVAHPVSPGEPPPPVPSRARGCARHILVLFLVLVLGAWAKSGFRFTLPDPVTDALAVLDAPFAEERTRGEAVQAFAEIALRAHSDEANLARRAIAALGSVLRRPEPRLRQVAAQGLFTVAMRALAMSPRDAEPWLRELASTAPALAGLLDDADAEVAAAAARSLTKLALMALPALRDSVRQGPPQHRVAAAGVLRAMAPRCREAVGCLLDVLADEAPEVRRVAAQGLLELEFTGSFREVHDRPFPILMARLADPEPVARRAAAELLARDPGGRDAMMVEWRTCLPPLLEALDAEPAQRGPALACLALLEDAALPELRRAFAGPDVTARRRAAAALGACDPESSLGTLVDAVADADAGVRREVVAALQRSGFGSAGARDAVLAARRDPDAGVRIQAVRVLGAWGKFQREPVPALLECFADPDPAVRLESVRAAAALAGTVDLAVPALFASLKDPDEGVRSAAGIALQQEGPLREAHRQGKAAVPILTLALSHRIQYLRIMAAKGLVQIGAAAVEALPALTAALADPDHQVRAAVAEALRNLGPAAKPAAADLVRALADRESDVRRQAALALGAIGDVPPEAIPALEKAAGDTFEDVKHAAAIALKEIQEIRGRR